MSHPGRGAGRRLTALAMCGLLTACHADKHTVDSGAAMYTEAANLVINSPTGGDVLVNGQPFSKTVKQCAGCGSCAAKADELASRPCIIKHRSPDSTGSKIWV